MRLDDLNALDEDAAVNELLRCCGSSHWARRMAAERPFAGAAALTRTADAIWQSLDAADWLEAFGAHPRIGERTTSAWASAEQSGGASASGAVLERLAAANRDYEVRFGYIFIVCATGRTAGEMLALLEGRLPHAPQDEIRIAAEEQRKITRLRLMKLLNLEPDTTT